MLNARDICADYNRKAVLRQVCFNARPGQITSIVGPSGAGKSTLLKVLTGDHAFAGTVRLEGRDIAAIPLRELARIRAVLPQSTPLAFPFTVIEVVRLGLVNHPGQDHIARRALARVGLAGFEGRYYQELSGGEQQRVQLARVLSQVWEPVGTDGTARWLFMDEPVSSLDIAHQLQVMALAREFADRGGGVVMVMHDLNLTAMSADSVALLREGRLIVQACPEEVYRDDILGEAYGCRLEVGKTPVRGAFVLPQMVKVP